MEHERQTLIPARYDDLLASTALAHIATIGPDGSPQNNPIWFDWDGTYLRFGVAPDRQKARNLRRDPRVAVSIVDPANPGRYLEIRGQVIEFDADSDGSRLRRIIRKYTGADELPGVAGERVIVTIEPVRTSHMG